MCTCVSLTLSLSTYSKYDKDWAKLTSREKTLVILVKVFPLLNRLINFIVLIALGLAIVLIDVAQVCVSVFMLAYMCIHACLYISLTYYWYLYGHTHEL